MKTLIVLISLISFYSITTAQINHAPVVANVVVTQRTDGTMKVDITYNVSDAENDNLTITMEVSTDGGTTWDFAATQVTGDIGANITPGNGKAIMWDFYAEHPEIYGSNFKVRITADDGATGVTATVTYGGKIYNTVKIGNQTWLKENLDVGTKIYSTSGGFRQADNSIIEKYCYFNDAANCAKYGGLYEWTEAMQYVTTEGARGICPVGWHIPTMAEMQILQTSANSDAKRLVAVGEPTTVYTPTNETGFSALFSGSRSSDTGSFNFLGGNINLWSSTEIGSSASFMNLYSNSSNVYYNNNYKSYGCSVRCLKDSP